MKLQAGKPKAVAGVTDAIGGGGPARTNAAARTPAFLPVNHAADLRDMKSKQPRKMNGPAG